MVRSVRKRRLNLWDFDETLAASVSPSKRLAEKHPHVPAHAWFHDPVWATMGARVSPVIEPVWAELACTPGEHWVLTAREAESVRWWLENRAPLDAIDVVLTTSRGMDAPLLPRMEREAETAEAKLAVMGALLDDWDEIHLYDDSSTNIAAVEDADIPGLRGHLVYSARRKQNPVDTWYDLAP